MLVVTPNTCIDVTTWLPSLGCVGQLERDIYQSAELRRDARRFGSGGEHHRDFTDALALMAAGLPEWEWPAGGVPVEAVWTRNKWRHLELE